MDVLSAEPNGHTNSSDLMNVPKVEHNPRLVINRFDGLPPLKVSFASKLAAEWVLDVREAVAISRYDRLLCVKEEISFPDPE
jgi:hypothetical protein